MNYIHLISFDGYLFCSKNSISQSLYITCIIRPVLPSLCFQSFDFSLSKNLSNLKNAKSFSINTDPVLNAASLVALGPFIFACNTSCNFSFGDVPIGGCTTFCVDTMHP